ncbi:hypothetical protein DXV76_12905 [Rhodobacteraceae bacterium CCMM004]|nr:hypothetical protein DXV76_12905 [Rhodobacteraceae bacterium CCMM004]
MPPFDTNLAEQSARYLALLAAFDAPATPQTAADARSAELARILAFAPETLPEVTAVASALLTERDFAAGCQPGVAYDGDSLRTHFQTDRATILSAAKLCGAMPFERNGTTVWADDERIRYKLDSGAIEWANSNLEGRE